MDHACVLVVKGQGKEHRYRLEEGKEYLIGAGADCGILIDDSYVSSKHFTARLEHGNLLVQDMNSRNGLFLLLTGQTPIQPGQSLLAGQTLVRFEQEPQNGQSVPGTP